MPSPLCRSLPIAGVAVLLTAALALADPPAGAPPHVRPETADAQSLLDELIARSPTARALVGELDRSTVLVYLRYRVFISARLNGRIGLVRSSRPTRTLIVELPCSRLRIEQLVTLGHELQHAVEIARQPAIVSPAALAAHFSRIGIRTSGPLEADTFETVDAIRVSTMVHKELLGIAARTTHDRH